MGTFLWTRAAIRCTSSWISARWCVIARLPADSIMVISKGEAFLCSISKSTLKRCPEMSEITVVPDRKSLKKVSSARIPHDLSCSCSVPNVVRTHGLLEDTRSTCQNRGERRPSAVLCAQDLRPLVPGGVRQSPDHPDAPAVHRARVLRAWVVQQELLLRLALGRELERGNLRC